MAYVKIEVEGFAGGDPEMRYTPSGLAVTSFSLAHGKSRFNQQTKEWEDLGTDWYRITTWREAAERTAEWVTKGAHLLVIGRFEQQEYERQDGTKGFSLEITADVILPLGKRTDGGGRSAPDPAESAYAPREAAPASVSEPSDLDDLPF